MAFRIRSALVLGLVAAIPASVMGTDEPPAEPSKAAVSNITDATDPDQAPAAATVDRIMEQAVRNISVRYNLNDAQTAETHELMKREVYRFLKDHENEVWPAIRDLLAAGLKTPEDTDDRKRLGAGARPLAKLAAEAIFRANEEWRLLLRADQKRVHDFDMAEMETTFGKIDKTFGEWEAGRATAEGLFPQPQLEGREPPRPSEPPPGIPDPTKELFDPSHIFDTLANDFIREYQLEEGQVTSVRSILKEFKGQASDYVSAQKLQFARVAGERQEAYKARDRDAIQKAAATHKKLLEPIYGLCTQLRNRLEALLTTAQIQRHAEGNRGRAGAPKGPALTKKADPENKTPPAQTSPKTAPETAGDGR